jgi:hypothetical protein
VARHLTTAVVALLTAVTLLPLSACTTAPSATVPPTGTAPSGADLPRAGTPAARALPSPPWSQSPAPITVPPAAAGSATAPPTEGQSWGLAALTAAPAPPRLLALPRDFDSPEAVAAAYLAAWCYTPVDQAANTNLQNASRWMTAAGWTDDTARAIDEPTWAHTRAAGVGTVCGPVTATVSVQGPNTDAVKWVAVSAMQARTRGGVLIGQSPVTVMRRVLLATGGRWLVDVRVNAG